MNSHRQISEQCEDCIHFEIVFNSIRQRKYCKMWGKRFDMMSAEDLKKIEKLHCKICDPEKKNQRETERIELRGW